MFISSTKKQLTTLHCLQPIKRDGFPQLICKDCYRQLKKTYEFCVKCENSDKQMRNVLSDIKVDDNKPCPNGLDEESLCDIKEDNVKIEPSIQDNINFISAEATEEIELKSGI